MGVLLSQYGVACAIYTRSVEVGLARVIPSFGSWLVVLFPIMLMRALTYWIVILCEDHLICLTIAQMNSLSTWLWCDDQWHMWPSISWILLRFHMNMKVSCRWWIVVVMVFIVALKNYVLSMFCRLGSHSTNWRLHSPKPTMSPTPCSFGGMKHSLCRWIIMSYIWEGSWHVVLWVKKKRSWGGGYWV